MNRPKLRSGLVHPAVYAVPDPDREPEETGTRNDIATPSAKRQLRSVPWPETRGARRPAGSYCLRRSAESMVTSVYLSRVLQSIHSGCEREGEAFLSDLALVWISGDGSREVVLKGGALRRLVTGRL